MFTYMTPMMSGVERRYSTAFDNFWCCVGSGMESHAKHGESIYWRSEDTLYVNLYYASTLKWKERGAEFAMETAYPDTDRVTLRVVRSGKQGLKLALRVPGWCATPSLVVNGKPEPAQSRNGYITLGRAWRDGDVLELTLPMPLRVEPTPDNPRVVAFMSGPLVLAADLGAPLTADAPREIPPALVTSDASKALAKVDGERHVFSTGAAGRPRPLQLRPFYDQYRQRTAIYFPMFTESDWEQEKQVYAEEHKKRTALEARTVDQIYLGEMQPERDHQLTADRSEPVTYLGRKGRILQGTGFFEFTMAVRPEPLALRAVYWGEDRDRHIEILIDGQLLATERLAGPGSKQFVEKNYPIPAQMISGKNSITVRFSQKTGHWTSVYGCRLLREPEVTI
jgi:uncharacterized protein